MREVEDKPTAACMRAVRALEVAARKRGVSEVAAFRYRYTAEMLYRHVKAWDRADGTMARPEGAQAVFPAMGGQA